MIRSILNLFNPSIRSSIANWLSGSAVDNQSAPTINELSESCEDLAACRTSFEATKKAASVLLRMVLKYYDDVRLHAERSFTWALRIASFGTVLFVVAIHFAWMQKTGAGWITMIAGALVQVIS